MNIQACLLYKLEKQIIEVQKSFHQLFEKDHVRRRRRVILTDKYEWNVMADGKLFTGFISKASATIFLHHYNTGVDLK